MISLPTPTLLNLLVAWTMEPQYFFLNVFASGHYYSYRGPTSSWEPDTDRLNNRYLLKLEQAHANGNVIFAIPTSASTPAEVELLHPELFL